MGTGGLLSLMGRNVCCRNNGIGVLLSLKEPNMFMIGPGSSVGIATDYGDRIPEGRDFPPVQTGHGAHIASCIMGTGSFPAVKYGRGVTLTTHPLLMPPWRKSRAIPLPTLWAKTGPVTETFTFTFNKFMGTTALDVIRNFTIRLL